MHISHEEIDFIPIKLHLLPEYFWNKSAALCYLAPGASLLLQSSANIPGLLISARVLLICLAQVAGFFFFSQWSVWDLVSATLIGIWAFVDFFFFWSFSLDPSGRISGGSLPGVYSERLRQQAWLYLLINQKMGLHEVLHSEDMTSKPITPFSCVQGFSSSKFPSRLTFRTLARLSC